MRAFVVSEGWRKFLFEIAVVVIGVLLALSAQQAVDALATRSQVKAFRETVDAEIAYNLAAYRDRLSQSPCLKRRLDELERLLTASRSGTTPALAASIGSPDNLALRTSAWQVRTDVVFSNIPLHQRIDYAAMYSAFDTFTMLRERESVPWRTLQEFDGATALDRDDLRRLRGSITSARRVNEFTEVNWPALSALASRMGIRPRRDTNDPASISSLCKPLFESA